MTPRLAAEFIHNAGTPLGAWDLADFADCTINAAVFHLEVADVFGWVRGYGGLYVPWRSGWAG